MELPADRHPPIRHDISKPLRVGSTVFTEREVGAVPGRWDEVSYGRLDLLCLDLCRHRDYADRLVRVDDPSPCWTNPNAPRLVPGSSSLQGPREAPPAV